MTEKQRVLQFLRDRFGVRFTSGRLAREMLRPRPSVRRDLVQLFRGHEIDRLRLSAGGEWHYYVPGEGRTVTDG